MSAFSLPKKILINWVYANKELGNAGPLEDVGPWISLGKLSSDRMERLANRNVEAKLDLDQLSRSHWIP